MAKRKVYRVTTGIELSFSAMVNKRRVLITFSGENASFTTVNEEIQKRIEGRPDYGTLIVLVNESVAPDYKEQHFTEQTTPQEKEKDETVTVVNNTTDWQEAKEFLRAAPYNIPYQSLGTPEKILAKATDLGVQFPNLILDA